MHLFKGKSLHVKRKTLAHPIKKKMKCLIYSIYYILSKSNDTELNHFFL